MVRNELEKLLFEKTNLIGHEGSGKEFWCSYEECFNHEKDMEFHFSLYTEGVIEFGINPTNSGEPIDNWSKGIQKGLERKDPPQLGLRFEFKYDEVDKMLDIVNQFEVLTLSNNKNIFPYPELLKQSEVM